jgi:hypothetical protein
MELYEGNGLLGRPIVGTVRRGGKVNELGETKILSSAANTWRGLGEKLNVNSIWSEDYCRRDISQWEDLVKGTNTSDSQSMIGNGV